MTFLGQVAVGASAAQDAGRWDVNLEIRQEAVRDCPSAAVRDSLSAMSAQEFPVSPARQAQPLQDAQQKAAFRLRALQEGKVE
jgi:hypothetical protein